MTNLTSFHKIKQYCEARNVKLIAVSKTVPEEEVLKLFELGHRSFGENRAQHLIKKHEDLPKEIEWHMIGHLQRNKVKYIAPFVSMVHAVDSLRLLREIDKEAKKYDREIPCLLQIYIADEETKFGLNEGELNHLLESKDLKDLQNVRICGLMGMATFTDNKEKVRKEFRYLSGLFETTRSKYFAGDSNFKELSMGMSNDFEIAIEEGSTMVRIGSLLFSTPD